MRGSVIAGVAFALGALAEPIPFPYNNLLRPYITSCLTRSSCEPGPKTLPTTYTTKVSTITSTKSVLITSTVTPAASTALLTSTVSTTTTAPASTLTATTTQSTTSTITVTTASVSTTTSTITTFSTTTTTVPISVAFNPVKSTIPNSSNRGSGNKPVAKRNIEQRDAAAPPLAAKQASYPQAVNCVALSKSTITVTKTTTSTATASKPTVTSVATTTVTSTVFPSATTTVTTDTTIFTTSTATTSTTSTVSTTTTVAAAATYYAACGPDNIIDTVGSSYIGSGSDEDGQYTFTSSSQTNAYDCCVAAYTNPNGNPAHFIYIPSYGTTNCFAYSAQTCANQQANTKSIFVSSRTNAAAAWTLGQFQCGTWDRVTGQ